MLMTLAVATALLILSFALNLYLYSNLTKLKKAGTQATYDTRQLLHDLTRGAGLVKVTRVAPEDVLLRSPRDLTL